MQVRRLVLGAGMAASLVAALTLPARAATVAGASGPTAGPAPVSAVPGGAWGVYASCPSQPAENCGEVRSVVTIGSTVYLAGAFTALVNPSTGATLPYQNVAALDEASGQPVTGFAAHTIDGTAYALAAAPDGSSLYIGGSFSGVDGVAGTARLVALDPATGAVQPFPAAVPNTVRTILPLLPAGAVWPAGGKVYIGGSFASVQNKPRKRVAALDPVTATVDPTFLASPVAYDTKTDVRSLAFGLGADGVTPRLYLAGHFDTVGGDPHASLAAVDPSTGAVDPTFTPVVDQSPNDPLQAGDQVLPVDSAGGTRPAGVLLGQAGHWNRAYRFSLTGARAWTFSPDGDVQAVAISGTNVYLGGHFVCVQYCYDGNATNDVTRTHIAAVSYTSVSNGAPVVDSTWSPALTPTFAPYYYGVWSLWVAGNGDLWAGGAFKYVVSGGRTYAQPKLTVFRTG